MGNELQICRQKCKIILFDKNCFGKILYAEN